MNESGDTVPVDLISSSSNITIVETEINEIASSSDGMKFLLKQNFYYF